MPDIPVGAQIFDLAFHPNRPIVYTGLLTGHIKAFGYDEQGNHEAKFSLRPSKKSCRALALSMDGDQLWAAGKAKAIQCVLSLLEERTGRATYIRRGTAAPST
ncbi:WD repeat-containing protein JIP5 [Trametes pubescens]|uniref:WD repeat-containing protein JIP5 n=1 Tax=Trametes pubescens TaxID=154538 RepID=A0A1M2W1L7_TRAPU|nr:WD repeat-containing protein JIP5 [Trametes pubescens]